jgi:tripartite motif-containing protein 9/67
VIVPLGFSRLTSVVCVRVKRHKMEEELKCSLCKHFFNQPVLLPCFHAVCLPCASQNQQPVNLINGLPNNNAPNSCSSVSELSELSCSNTDCNDSDKLSILSEADSGVVVSSGSIASRPSSYIGTNIVNTPPTTTAVAHLHISSTNHATAATGASTFFFSLSCPTCRKVVYFDENGAQNLPRYRAMQTIVDKYVETKTLGQFCQLCEPGPQAPNQSPNEASVFCEQCQVFYCETCRDHCHPARGPLAKHTLMTAQQGRMAARCHKEKLKVTIL